MSPKPSQVDCVMDAHYKLWTVLGGKDPFPLVHLARAASYTVEIEERAVEMIKELKTQLEEQKENIERRVAEETRKLGKRVEKLERVIAEKNELLAGFRGRDGKPPRRPSTPGANCAQQ